MDVFNTEKTCQKLTLQSNLRLARQKLSYESMKTLPRLEGIFIAYASMLPITTFLLWCFLVAR